MAHYERLANGKYAYTTTVQVISGEEFTNPNHSIITGSGFISSANTKLMPALCGNPTTFSVTGTPRLYGSSIEKGNASIYGARDGAKIENVTIDNNTYYGVKASTTVIATGTSSNTSTTIKPATITTTYILNNQIQISTFQTDSKTIDVTGSEYGLIYLQLGISANAIILNVNIQST